VSFFKKIIGFFQGRDEKKIESALEKIKNPKAIREDRVAAIHFVSTLDSWDQAVPVLLQRFEYSLEHGINDTREKELCLKCIVAYGKDSLPAVKKHLMNSLRIAWPIKVIKELGDDAHLADILFECLDFTDISLDQAKVDKNYDILCYLRESKLELSKIKQLAHFLEALDERVRFAAAEVLIEQIDPIVASYLERFLGDESPDNTRIRQASLQAFINNRWKLSNPSRFQNGHVVGPIYVHGDGTLFITQTQGH
jgi:hypothetical protein